jgi:hypothetical protein
MRLTPMVVNLALNRFQVSGVRCQKTDESLESDDFNVFGFVILTPEH